MNHATHISQGKGTEMHRKDYIYLAFVVLKQGGGDNKKKGGRGAIAS